MFHYFSTASQYYGVLCNTDSSIRIPDYLRTIKDEQFPCLVYSYIWSPPNHRDELCINFIKTEDLMKLIPMRDICGPTG